MIACYLAVRLLVSFPRHAEWVVNAEKSEGQHSCGRTSSGALTPRCRPAWPGLARYSMQVHLS